MSLTISGRNYEVRHTTRKYLERKLQKFHKLASVSRVDVKLSDLGSEFEADIKIHAGHGDFFAVHRSGHLRSTIDRCLDKIERQLHRRQGKRTDRRRRPTPLPIVEATPEAAEEELIELEA